MTGVEVDRLSLRCDLARREPARFALEDALRTELPDDGRLVLVRKLQVAPAGSSPRPAWRQAAMREAWAAATGGARHGGEDGAAEANCVWFASPAEAERLLLDCLLRGRAAEGWFWKLALPRWRGRPAADWLPELLAEAAAPEEESRLLALVETCLAAGAEQVFVTAIKRAEPFRTVGFPWPKADPPRSSTGSSGRARAPTDHAPRRAASMVVDTFAPALRTLLRRLVGSSRGEFAVRAIVRARLLRVSPALDLAPAVREHAVVEALRQVAGSKAPAEGRRSARETARAGTTERKTAPAARKAEPRTDPDTQARPRPVARLHSSRPDASSDVPTARVAPAAAERPEAPLRLPLHSRHAGLWLVVPALGDMGLRAWLARQPELLGEHPGARLMLAIARRHRVPADDPALAPFAELGEGRPAGWAEAWRHGLDRWLRRHARRRLHDLVNRPGRIAWDEQRLDVTYPPGDADIRLRRLALDRDPGWTDWLGLSVRYRFRGQDEL